MARPGDPQVRESALLVPQRHLSGHEGRDDVSLTMASLLTGTKAILKAHSRRGYFSCLSCGLHVTTRTKLSLLGPVTKLLVEKNQRAVKGSFNSGG